MLDRVAALSTLGALRTLRHPCSTGPLPAILTVPRDPLHRLHWAHLPAPLLSVFISLSHGQRHSRPHCPASLGKPPSPCFSAPLYTLYLLQLRCLLMTGFLLQGGASFILSGPWSPMEDLVHTGQGSVLAGWLNSGKGWEGFQVLLRYRGRSAFLGRWQLPGH